jgi:hypothetical protein
VEIEVSSDGIDGNTTRVSPSVFQERLHALKFNMFLNFNSDLYLSVC